jgi:hypothetical protein
MLKIKLFSGERNARRPRPCLVARPGIEVRPRLTLRRNEPLAPPHPHRPTSILSSPPLPSPPNPLVPIKLTALQLLPQVMAVTDVKRDPPRTVTCRKLWGRPLDLSTSHSLIAMQLYCNAAGHCLGQFTTLKYTAPGELF